MHKLDVKLLNFITDSEFVITAEVAAKYFYESLNQAQRRLKILYDKKYLKRSRPSINSQYLYYCAGKKHGQKTHRAIATEFYLKFISVHQISKWEWGGRSMKKFGVMPDLIFWHNNQITIIEIGNTKLISRPEKKEIYKNMLNANKHVKLYCVSSYDPKLKMQYKWINLNEIGDYNES